MLLPKVIRGVPSALTLTSLCLGLWAVKFAINGELLVATVCVLVSICLDGMDGRLARYLNTASNFGATLDTLADFASFGISPALLVYYSFLYGQHELYWAGVLFFSVCMSLRLARFTVAPAQHYKFFIGVPAPGGALLVLTPVFLKFAAQIDIGPVGSVLVLCLSGFLLISRIPTFAFNKVKFKPEWMSFISVTFAMLVSAIFFFPWHMLLFVNLLYILTFPFSIKSYNKVLKEQTKI